MSTTYQAVLPRRLVSFDVPDLRAAGGLMLGAAVILPLLPPHPEFVCPLRAVTGIPCPLCGMTTSVEATMHGHLGTAAAATPCGIAAVVIALWLLARPPARVQIPAYVGVLVLFSMWVFQLFRFDLLSV